HLFFQAPAPTDIYTLSLHDALPISLVGAVLAPHDAEDAEFGVAGLAAKQRDDLLVLRRGQLMRGDDIGCDDSHSYLTARLATMEDRKSTRLNSSHLGISYAVFCLKK